MLPINFPFPPCPYCSIHMTSLWLSVLQEASLNMHTHNKVTNRSSQTQSFTSKKCLPQSQILGSEPKGLSRGVCWEKWGLGQFFFFCFVADIDECANETLCGSHGFCENSDGSFRCLCDRGYESSPSGHYCIGESARITLPVSKGEPLAGVPAV